MMDLHKLPEGLPVPEDDGACLHLPGMEIPDLELASTAGRMVRLREASQALTVLFFYPRSGRPGAMIPAAWDLVPGARGCTPQACAYRDHHAEFRTRGASVFGVSSQDTEYQLELVRRNQLPYEILSDAEFRLTEALRLPTFVFDGVRLIKRLALVAEKARIVKVFYPVFPPDQNAENVLAWLKKKG
jgi:peroxiredoxin